MSPMFIEGPKFLAFAVFLLLGLLVMVRSTVTSRRAVSLLIGYVLLVSLLSGVTQIDVWPFTSYTLAAFRPRPRVPVCTLDFFGVDKDGREWAVDPLSFSPVYLSIVQTWCEVTYPTLTHEQQRRSLRFLVDRAESSRRSFVMSGRAGFDAILGRAWNPYWWLLPRRRQVSSSAYVALRIYRSCAIPEDVLDRTARPTRALVVEQRR